MVPIGTRSRPLRVAVVGTGPAGMYVAQSLLSRSDLVVSIDLIERLPVPYGLVRYGVAPDHQKIKNVTRVFDKLMVDDRTRFLGNVALGRDLSRTDLAHSYDQIVYAVGAPTDRRLGIPGENLGGTYSSTGLVAWYNAHPDEAAGSYPLSHEQVVVVGVGNVAMDVARILARSPDELATSDIADHALEELRHSPLRQIHLLARRGPVQAKCSPSELKELGALEGVQVVVDPADLKLDDASAAALEDDRTATKNLELLRGFAAVPPDPAKRQIRFRFLTSPVALDGDHDQLREVQIERNRLEERHGGYLAAVGTGLTEGIPATMVVRAIGYRSTRLVDLPFDGRRGVIPNEAGRIVDEDGDTLGGEYVVGWVKRGPTGLIGSNKQDAIETVDRMLEDLAASLTLPVQDPDPEAVSTLLEARGARVVSWDDWLRIDERERSRGQSSGRPRVKFPTVAEMLAAL